MRTDFLAIISGWALYSGTDDLDERLEEVATWMIANGPLGPDEEATVKFMIDCQIARHLDPSGGDRRPDDDEEDSCLT